MNYIAPAGTPLSLMDLLSGIGSGVLSDSSAAELKTWLSKHSGQPQNWLLTSGRAGMTLAFEAMKRATPDSRRRDIIIPGYTCYSVPAAAERAGLNVRLCDIDPRTLSMDAERLNRFDFSKVLGIVTANLFGIPNALSEIEALAREKNVLLLDDAAQALGATYAGRSVGGFGDVGLYSFDKGKNITTIQGGALVARDGALAREIDAAVGLLPRSSRLETFAYTVKLGIYGLLLQPRLYGVTQQLPFLGLGRTPYETTYPIRRYSETLAGLALRLANRLPEINSVRIQNAQRLESGLSNIAGLRLPAYPAAASPVFARYPVFVMAKDKRQAIIHALNAAGIGATCSYPRALADVPELSSKIASEDREQAGARSIADTVVTLPTHGYCPPDLAERARAIFVQCLR